MGHILSKVFPFLQSVFTHWQIWLSGGGIGGFVVITVGLVEKIFNKPLSKRAYIYLFLICFFLCSCYLSWVERDDQLQVALADKSAALGTIQTNKQVCQGQIADLNGQNQYKSGVVDTLGKQNRDQQNTINNCQTQAIKLLTPQPLKWMPLAWDHIPDGTATKSEWLLLTNKPVNPVDLLVSCSGTITSLTARIVASPTTAQAASLGQNQWEVKITSPTWDPINPVRIDTVIANSSDDAVCRFTLRDGVH